MDSTTHPARPHTADGLDLGLMDVGPAKDPAAARAGSNRYRRRVGVLGALLLAVWIGVLVDPRTGPTVLFLLGAFAAVLGLFGLLMGLGLVGFGLCTAGGRFIGWLRRGSRWPED